MENDIEKEIREKLKELNKMNKLMKEIDETLDKTMIEMGVKPEDIAKLNAEIDGEYNVEKDFIKDFTDFLNKMTRKTEKKEKTSKVWIPDNGERVFILNSDGTIIDIKYDTTLFSAYKQGNIFQTRHIAEKERNRRYLVEELNDFAINENEEDIDWDNTEQEKFAIFYDYNEDCYNITSTPICRECNFYFTSVEIAYKAIKTFCDRLDLIYKID